MPKIESSIEINTTKDRIWEVISDLDNESEYWWGTKEVKNISKEGNIINREIVQNFRNHRVLQKVILFPKEKIEIQYLKGLTEGVKVLSVETRGENVHLLKAFWDVKFTGIFRLATPFINSHVEKGTIEALQRIKDAAEGKEPVHQSKSKQEPSWLVARSAETVDAFASNDSCKI